MSKKDYYVVLEVPKDASEKDIKKAYKKLAHKHHPDRNDGCLESEAKFKEVAEAYSVLSDPQKRQQYDMYGHDAPRGNSGGNAGWGPDPFDMFNSFFGGGGRRQHKGRDLRIEILVTLEDVLSGVSKDITYKRSIKCKTCNGLGGSGKSCTGCGGYGQVAQQTGFVRVVTDCRDCQGAGVQLTSRCDDCSGKGYTQENNTVMLAVPKGVQSGNTIRVQGGGDLSDHRLPPGDLLCRVVVKPHQTFQRKNRDLQCIRNISFAEACVGTKIKVPTLEGEDAELSIPAGTQFGQSFRIKGRGVPDVSNAKRGNLFVKIQIDVPQDVTDEEKDLIQQFDKKIKDRA